MSMSLPPGFSDIPEYQDKVLQLDWSLYSCKYAAKLFYELIQKVLVNKLGFWVSKHDHCLFIWKDCIIITWVDDAIIITKEPGKANWIIEDILKHDLDLGKQGEGLAEYLGINIQKHGDGTMKMTQSGLIERIIEWMNRQNVNPKYTPVTQGLAKDKNNIAFNKHFNYHSVVGMLLYLANTTHPILSFSVNQCAQFSNDPKELHAMALKCIGCYLKAMADKEIIICQSEGIPTLDCWIDADFAGLYSKKDPKHPTSIQTQTGYVLVVIWLFGIPSCRWKLPFLQCLQNILCYQQLWDLC